MRRPAFLLLAVGGCVIFSTPTPDQNPGDLDRDGGSETDGGGDGGADGGGDAASADGGDPDTDTDTEPYDCEHPADDSPPADGCVSARISCGDTLQATTKGGVNNFGSGEYSAWYCLASPGGDYAGGERVFGFTHPGTGYVTVKLYSPCGELDLAAVRWGYWETDGYCPSEDNSIVECEMDDATGDGEVRIYQNKEASYLLVVDSPDAEEALFEISVECE